MNTRIYLLFILFATLTSCASRIPFTQAVRENYQLNENELKQLQFYVSHDITLSRVENDEKSKSTTDGKLIIKSGQEFNQILIKAGTPGIVEKVIDDKRIAVSFESPDKIIVFGDPYDRKGNYTLLAADWKNNKGVLKYGENEYFVNQGAANIYLMFKMSRLNQIKKEVRIAKGRKL